VKNLRPINNPLKRELGEWKSNDMQLLQRTMRAMERVAPLSLADTSWDNVGLLIEPPFCRSNANRVFLTVDLTPATLEEAIQDSSIGVIVAYHPPLFRPYKQWTLAEPKTNMAMHCVAKGIAVYSPHTALDNCVGGVNDWLIQGFHQGQGEVRPIHPLTVGVLPKAQEGAGMGRLALLKDHVTLGELVRRIKDHLKLTYVRVAMTDEHRRGKLAQTIAVCAGSGSSILTGVKADVLFTGEMGHHDVLSALGNNTSVILCEHSHTERGYLKEVLQPRLAELLGLNDEETTVEVVVSKVDKDPLELV